MRKAVTIGVNDREPRWTLFYDAECGFCTSTVAAILICDRRHLLVPCALQSPRAEALLGDMDAEQRLASVHLSAPGGERFSAGAALAEIVALLAGGAHPARALARSPRLSRFAYELVAGHRSQLSRALPASVVRQARARVKRAERESSVAPGSREN